jgi:EAL domain-containing protein (putative c-di-GMP-specific phosphodiesterase class I)
MAMASLLPASASLAPARPELIDRALQPGQLRPSFQPIVELDSGRLVAYEALARWPGIPEADPGSVFSSAAITGRVVELDWACRLASLQTAMDAELSADIALFLNVEAVTLGLPAPAGYQKLVAAAQGRLRVVLELTERALLKNPAELLQLVRWAREHGWGIAMDDVGAEPDSLALLPFVAPEVIKLDLSLIQDTHRRQQAATMLAVAAHAERTGAVLLAEGIETQAHLEQAVALGARYGQGWLLGRPGMLDSTLATAGLPAATPAEPVVSTPFELVHSSGLLRRGRKRLLLSISRQLEIQATAPGEPAVLLSAFQDAVNFTPATVRRYAAMAADLPFIGAFGSGLTTEPAPGVRGAALAPDDPLLGEWTVVVIGPHYAGALIARDCGDDGPDMDRRFDFLLTQDRESVLQAGRSLMSRITGQR